MKSQSSHLIAQAILRLPTPLHSRCKVLAQDDLPDWRHGLHVTV